MILIVLAIWQALAISYCCLVLYGSFNAGIGQDLRFVLAPESWAYADRMVVPLPQMSMPTTKRSVNIHEGREAETDHTKQHLYFGVIIAHLSYGFVKLAVLQFYKRIFAVPNFHLYANITIVVVILFMIAATFVGQSQRHFSCIAITCLLPAL